MYVIRLFQYIFNERVYARRRFKLETTDPFDFVMLKHNIIHLRRRSNYSQQHYTRQRVFRIYYIISYIYVLL